MVSFAARHRNGGQDDWREAQMFIERVVSQFGNAAGERGGRLTKPNASVRLYGLPIMVSPDTSGAALIESKRLHSLWGRNDAPKNRSGLIIASCLPPGSHRGEWYGWFSKGQLGSVRFKSPSLD